MEPPLRLYALAVASLSVFVFAVAWGQGAQRRPEASAAPEPAARAAPTRPAEVSRGAVRRATPKRPAVREQEQPVGTGAEKAAPEGAVYLVRTGDTLSGIARLFRTDPEWIRAANGLPSDTIRAGQRLRIPGAQSLRRHTVVEGDTLWELASRYGVGLEALLAANRGLDDPGHLQIGQELLIPPAGEDAGAAVAAGVTTSLASLKGLFAWPNDAPISSPFGPRWGRNHAGIDLAANHGDPIRASRDGRVLLAGNVPGYGLTVVLRHPDGTRTLYAHSSRLLVRAGQQVTQGEVIARVGSTGRSTGPHLHFEIIVNDRPRDPLQFLSPR